MSDSKTIESSDMLGKIYNARQEDFKQKANCDRKELEDRLKDTTIDEIKGLIEKNVTEYSVKQEILEKLEQLIENYEIKTAYYMEKRYKQGFKDGMNLLKQCEE